MDKISIKMVKQSALDTLKGNWEPALLATFLYIVISTALSFIPYISSLSFLITLPLSIGFCNSFLALYRKGDKHITDNLFKIGFSSLSNYARYLAAMLLVTIGIALISIITLIPIILTSIIMSLSNILWLKILGVIWIVLGFIFIVYASICFSFLSFLLVDKKDMGIMEVILQSVHLTKGIRWQIFIFCLSFIGWFFLSILTLGIGFLWLQPYFNTSLAIYYENVRKEKEIRKEKKISIDRFS